jgi:hypothetical protein
LVYLAKKIRQELATLREGGYSGVSSQQDVLKNVTEIKLLPNGNQKQILIAYFYLVIRQKILRFKELFTLFLDTL